MNLFIPARDLHFKSEKYTQEGAIDHCSQPAQSNFPNYFLIGPPAFSFKVG